MKKIFFSSEKENKEQKSEPIVVTSKKPSVLHVQMDKLEDIPITEQSMRSNIILIWKCPSLARYGKLALPTESLTTSDINQLQSSSLYWETEVNEKILLQSDDLFTSTVREVINIKTVVTNRSSVDYKQLKVNHHSLECLSKLGNITDFFYLENTLRH